MRTTPRLLCIAVALALHAALLWGVRLRQPPVIRTAPPSGDSATFLLTEEAPQPAKIEPPAPAPELAAPPPLPRETPPTLADFTPPPATTTAQAFEVPPPAPAASPRIDAKPLRDHAPSSHQRTAAAGSQTAITSAAPRAQPGDQQHATWLTRVTPLYPADARAAHQAGRVLVSVSVNAQGRATDARLASSSGFPALDRAALSSARASLYRPKTVAGQAQADTITVPYSFGWGRQG